MDGGSTDGTVDILERTDGNVIWRSERDRGQSHALNKAFEVSKGDYIGWINSDDALVDRRAVESAVRIFERSPDVGVVYGHGLLASTTNRVMQVIWAPPYFRPMLNLHTYFVQPAAFIRRSVLSTPFVDESLDFVMDRDLWARLLAKTRFKRMEVLVALDRQQPERKSLDDRLYKEWQTYEAARGVDLASRPVASAIKMETVTCRIAGTPWAARLPQRIDPAIDLNHGTILERIKNQLLVPRVRMDMR